MAAFKALPLGWAGSCSPRKERVRTGNQKLPAQQAVSVLSLPRDTRQRCIPPLLVRLDCATATGSSPSHEATAAVWAFGHEVTAAAWPFGQRAIPQELLRTDGWVQQASRPTSCQLQPHI